MIEHTDYFLACIFISTLVVGGVVQLKYLYFFLIWVINWVVGDIVFGKIKKDNSTGKIHEE